MAKATKTETEKQTLTAGKINTIAKVWNAGATAAATAGGNLALAIVNACGECGGTSEDARLVIEQVAEGRNWSDVTTGIMRSQCKAFMNVGPAPMKRAINAIIAKYQTCGMDMAYIAARAINDGKDPMKAVADRKKGKNGQAQRKRAQKAPSTKGAALASTADEAIPQAFKALIGLKDLPRGFKAALEKLAADFDYSL